MLKWIGGFIDRIFAVAGALALSQFPLFMQQYQQHLSGRVAELQMQVQAMRNAAALTGKSLQQYVMKFLQNGDADFKNQGAIMNSMVERYNHLTEGYNALHDSSIFSKPVMFIRYFDWDIAQSTWQSFEIGFSFSLEVFIYAALGIVVGLFAYWIMGRIFRAMVNKLRPA